MNPWLLSYILMALCVFVIATLEMFKFRSSRYRHHDAALHLVLIASAIISLFWPPFLVARMYYTWKNFK